MKKELDKWQIVFSNRPVYEMMVPLLRELTIGIVKFTSFPVEGAMIEKKHYKGFMFTIRFYKWFEFK